MLPLRLRRTLLYTLAFTAVQTAIVTGASLAQLSALRESHEGRVVQEAVAVTRALPGVDADGTDLREAMEPHGDLLYVELLDPAGAARAWSDDDIAPGVPRLASSEFDSVRFGAVELTAPAAGVPDTVSQVVVPFRDAEGRRGVLRALASTTTGRVFRAELAYRLWIVLPASFVAAALVSWMLLRRTLDPLRAVSAQIRRLGPESLSRGHTDFDPIEADEDVVRLQRSLAEALERMEDGYQAQTQFVANVAHELKTPIAVMLAEAQSLRGDDVSAEELREFRESVTQEMRRLGKMVESFLVVARASRGGTLTRDETVFLPEVVVDAVQHSRRLAETHDVRVSPLLPDADVAGDLQMDGDPELLASMLENLIRNAIRFTPAGDVVTVSLERDGDRARIAVRDRGPGVPMDLAERLFERYVQADGDGESVPRDEDSPSGRARGFGLGLSIAANVARLHGGSIFVRNDESGGAVFTVTLPLGESGLDAAAALIRNEDDVS